VCTCASDRASARGPSPLPLGVMAVGYNWTCTACGAANAAGTDICRQCGSNAITSAHEIEIGANTRRRPPLTAMQKALTVLSAITGVPGAFLFWIFSPPEPIWLVGLGLLGISFMLLGAMKVRGGRHDP
jgi:hypothetical protein